MGFRYRKSINLGGGFRINLSKSGVGYSFGGKGFRITKTAKGHVRGTVSLPGTGVSYVTESSGNKKKPTAFHNNSRQKPVNGFWKKALILFSLILVFLTLSVALRSPKTDISPVSSISSFSSYTVQELLELDGHPRIFDSFPDAKEFYSPMDGVSVEVVSAAKYGSIQRKVKERFDDNVVLYLIQDSSSGDTVGTITINIFDESLSKEMDLDSAVSFVVQYLPTDFIEYYKLDAAYIYGNEEIQVYNYACRLNESGVEHHNAGASQYSFYYDVKIFHYIEENYWRIETGYEAFGGHSLSWIEKYSTPWEIDLSSYF